VGHLVPSLSFRLVLKAFENFEYPWDAQASSLLLLCLLNGFQVFFRVKQVVKKIAQRPVLGLDSCEWLGVWDSMGKYLGQWTLLMFFKLTPEQVQNLDKLVKYLQKVCCHPGNSRDTQITTTCWGLAHDYRAMFNLMQCLKGERGGNEAARTVSGAAPPTGPVAPSGRAPAAGIMTEPNDQPVPVAVAPVKLKTQRKQITPGGMTMSQGHRGRWRQRSSSGPCPWAS